MIRLIIFQLVIFLVHQVHAQEFSAAHQDLIKLHKIEERLLPFLNTFISEREAHLKELEDVLSKTAAVRAMSGQDMGEYLGNPLNQFHVVKRFVDDWGRLADYLNSDTSTDNLLYQMGREVNKFPGKAELSKSLRDLEKTNGIDPEGYRVML